MSDLQIRLLEIQKEKITRAVNNGDILTWGKLLFPDKFNLPYCYTLHEYFIEIQDESFTSTLAPRGHAKCLDGETSIYGDFGIKKLRDVKENDVVYSLDSINKVVKQKVLAVRGEQYKKGYLLTTRSGRELKLSDEHRMFTFNGYKRIEEISKNDYIGVINSKINNDYSIDINELKFISYMIFEGCCTNRSISISEDILINDFRNICENLGIVVKKKSGNNCDFGLSANRTSMVRKLLEKYKIANHLSYDKRLPNEFFKMSYKQKMIFLSIMIDTDGYISQQAGNIGIALANKKLIEDIQMLLSTCGIISSKTESKNDKAGAWRLSINGKYAHIFLEDGNVLLKKKKLEKLLNKDRYSLFDIYPNKIKKSVLNIERLARELGIRVDNKHEITRNKLERLSYAFPDCLEFKKQLDQDIFWDKVIDIKRIDETEEYFDIQVDKTENFFANGMVSHNTTIKCFLIPIYKALNHPEDYKHYLNVQSTTSKAINVNINIKDELENNELLREYYGEQVGDKWTEKQFVLKNGVIFTGIGCGESTRGLNYKNVRPDYIIGDDLYDDEDINNPTRIDKKEAWLWGTLYPARAKDKKNCVHLQGTAIDRTDILHKLENNEKVMFRKFQAVIDEETKEVLWKELNTFEGLMAEKEMMGSNIFYREYQNECRDPEAQIIKDSWIQYYDGNFPDGHRTVGVFCGVDPSVGKKLTSDYTGIAIVRVMRVENSLRWYVDDLVNEHLSQKSRIDAIDNKHKQWLFKLVYVEAIAAFGDFSGELIRTTDVPVKEIDHVKDKITNLENNSSKFENGKVFINTNINKKLRDELVYQLTTNEPRHDDLRDGLLTVLNGTDSKMKTNLDGLWSGDDRQSIAGW